MKNLNDNIMASAQNMRGFINILYNMGFGILYTEDAYTLCINYELSKVMK